LAARAARFFGEAGLARRGTALTAGRAGAQHRTTWTQFPRPAAEGLAESAGEHLHYRGGKGGAGRQIDEVRGLDPARETRKSAMSPTTLLLGVTLTMSPKRAFDLAVIAHDLRPARAEAEGVGLLAQVGVLAAGHLVVVNFGAAKFRAGVEGLVKGRTCSQ
jgi:hypothetical protein